MATDRDSVPTEADWREWRSDLDRRSAHQRFAGRDRRQAAALFRGNVIERVDELRFMPPVPFRYYLLALRDYVVSDQARGHPTEAADAAACFLDLVVEKLQARPGLVEPLLDELLPALEYLAAHQDAYDAPRAIYGDFQQRLTAIRRYR